MDTKTKIILRRPSQWMNRIRSYRVFINGQQVGTIKNGATEEYSVEAGANSIECKINWCGSQASPVNLQPGETAYLKVASGMKLYYFFVGVMAVGVFLYVYYRNNPDKPSWTTPVSLVALFSAALYSLYYVTFGRKDYLVVEKDTKNVFA